METDTANPVAVDSFTPVLKWTGIVEVLAEAAANGTTAQARDVARAELLRLARIADELVPTAMRALHGAEAFMVGFEDATDQVGVKETLAGIRAAMATHRALKKVD